MGIRSAVLRSTSDGLGTRHLQASLWPDGTLRIEGQDLGGGVRQFFGSDFDEYEWAWTIRSEDVPQLVDALAAGDDVLAALRLRFLGEAAAGLQPFLDEHGIPYETWSRVGW